MDKDATDKGAGVKAGPVKDAPVDF